MFCNDLCNWTREIKHFVTTDSIGYTDLLDLLESAHSPLILEDLLQYHPFMLDYWCFPLEIEDFEESWFFNKSSTFRGK